MARHFSTRPIRYYDPTGHWINDVEKQYAKENWTGDDYENVEVLGGLWNTYNNIYLETGDDTYLKLRDEKSEEANIIRRKSEKYIAIAKFRESSTGDTIQATTYEQSLKSQRAEGDKFIPIWCDIRNVKVILTGKDMEGFYQTPLDVEEAKKDLAFNFATIPMGGSLTTRAAKLFGFTDDVAKVSKHARHLNKAVDVAEGARKLKHPVLDNSRVGSALKDDFYHSFDDVIDNYAVDAKRFDLPNKKGHLDSLYQIEGSMVKYETKYVKVKNNAPKMIQNKQTINGVFEWVVDPTANTVTHRTFIPNGKVTGKINQWGK